MSAFNSPNAIIFPVAPIPMKFASLFLPALLLLSFRTEARDLEIVAHRGANHLAPENTIAATIKCVELGIDYVEVDVRTSSDGVLYILHDATLDRTTNGTGLIRDRDSGYIDNLDAGSWFDEAFAGERVPRLKPYLESFKGSIKVYFDVKDADLADLVSLVEETGFADDCFFWFSKDDRARELRQLDSQIPLKMNAVDVPGLERVLDYNPQIIEYRLENLTPDFVVFAKKHNLKLMAHALEDGAESKYPEIIDSAADMVNLDKADLMIQLLKKVD